MDLKVNEIFKGIQGESTYAGLPTVFIRLTGCNLRCSYCDTTYAYDEGKEYTMQKLLGKVDKFNCKIVEVTGGEPLLQKNSFDLINQLINKKYLVLLETNGTVSLNKLNPLLIKIMDIKCPGSGVSGNTKWDNINYLTSKDQIKFVISNREDFDWAVKVIKKRNLDKLCAILFSPNIDQFKIRDLAEWILLENINVRLQPQLHKYIWGKDIRGV